MFGFLQRMDHIQALLLFPFLFFTTVTSQGENVCSRPELGSNIEMAGLQRFFNPGAELTLSCKRGYTPVAGLLKIVCGASGQWSKIQLVCAPVECPNPGSLSNGEIIYENTAYQSTINFTCNIGYIMNGPSSAVCQANGTWSSKVPECKPVTCGLAPIPLFGMVVYDRKVRGNSTVFGTKGTYKCMPPYVVFDDPLAECTADGTWTPTPRCQVVICPPPQNITHGYLSNQDARDFTYSEKIKYGCEGNYVLEGSREIFCQKDGTWSEKPSCLGPCSVNIPRGRILYNGQKIWIADLQPNRILHKEIISVYCMDKARKCGYPVPTQCINGNLPIPECFEVPGMTEYNLSPSSLPSEIKEC